MITIEPNSIRYGSRYQSSFDVSPELEERSKEAARNIITLLTRVNKTRSTNAEAILIPRGGILNVVSISFLVRYCTFTLDVPLISNVN